MTRYYDLVLGLIPLALGGIAALLSVLGFALTTAIPIASVVAVGLIGHAMFVNGPVDSAPRSAPADDGFQPAD
ncbi:hypothetical protein C475_05905 [Halosimplex carlsbadense 2-9-1]|uniref:Uncharacterized protein n=1 Tax=Halosimplex carlsbadense 2-9-1 TaxID=797114 RepID=M0CZW4_9EURY|nr:hypothetical protein [Halosimplex carlsbadense]ELZ27429.1 hypothetical protein C475_05905 [Halosimplex carlsbadense 2-9-1]